MSPEQINESKYNEKSDIWSAGCLLYEISSLKPPFEATNHLILAIKIKSGKVERIPQRYSEDLWRMIQAMLCVDPEKRVNIQELLSFPNINIRI
jgi:NIMA (never in mitosis gene a)-related kinase 2